VRILYLNPSAKLGGAERSLLDLMWSIRRTRPDWQLAMLTGEDGELVARAREMGVASEVFPMPPILARLGDAGAGGPAGGGDFALLALLARMAKAAPAAACHVGGLRREISRIAPDLIHSNGFKSHLFAAWAAPRHTPIIWHVRDYLGSRPLMARLLPLHSARCGAAVANSNSVASDVRTTCRGLEVHTVYNAVDLDRFSPEGSKADLDSLAGLPAAPSKTVRVGLLATMARWKGHEVFLRALSTISPSVPIRGYIVGGALYQTYGSQYESESLHKIAGQLGISSRVGFTGFVSDPATAIRALDIVVHASTEPEPFGRVIAEAMACSKSVVASATGGAAEIISDRETALSHAPGDAGDLARCVAALAADSALRERLGKAGRAVAQRRFDRVLLADNLVPIYHQLVSAAA
jgi:glycosyltransferase involved in cell wall biosynthesis